MAQILSPHAHCLMKSQTPPVSAAILICMRPSKIAATLLCGVGAGKAVGHTLRLFGAK